jgi:hypothetical protein
LIGYVQKQIVTRTTFSSSGCSTKTLTQSQDFQRGIHAIAEKDADRSGEAVIKWSTNQPL